MHCSTTGSSIHGVSKARILGMVDIPPPGDLPDPGIEPWSPALQVDYLPSEPPGKSTEVLYKKDLNDPDNYNGVVTHLEPNILGCEVKWALGSITTNKANGGDGIPAELAISSPKIWCCLSNALNMPANLENSAVATGLEKISFHSNPKERQCWRMFKLLHNGTHLTC